MCRAFLSQDWLLILVISCLVPSSLSSGEGNEDSLLLQYCLLVNMVLEMVVKFGMLEYFMG